jgi:outer membrane protein assembly factor BamB
MGARGAWMAAPLATEEFIFVPNSDGSLYILDLQGNLVNSIELGGSLWSQPVNAGGLVYVASLDHHVHVIQPSTHEILQTVDLGGAVPGGLTADEDGVYVGSFTGRMEFVSGSGQTQTLVESEDWIWGAPTLDSDTLYFADLGGRVYSFDLAGRRQNWSDVQPDGPVAASPLLAGDSIIIVTESGSVYAFDSNGQEAWPQPYAAGGKIYTSPVSAGDLILVAPYHADSLLLALDLQGRLVWDFVPPQ